MSKEEWLNKLLGDELIAHLQYAIAAKTVEGTDYDACKAEFEQHSKEELEHFNKLLDLMVEREILVNSDIQDLIKISKSGYTKMIKVDSKYLVEFHHEAELNAIKAYKEFLEYLLKEDKDLTLIDEIKHILHDEVEHKADLGKIFTSLTDGKHLKKESKFNY